MGPAHRHYGTAGQVGAVVPLAEHRLLQCGQGKAARAEAVGAGQPLGDHVQAEPGPQLQLGAGVEDRGIAGERHLGIREPGAVIGVGHVIGSAQLRVAAGPEDAGLNSVRVAAPAARRG